MVSLLDTLYLNPIANIIEKLFAINDSRLINKVRKHFHLNESQISDIFSGKDVPIQISENNPFGLKTNGTKYCLHLQTLNDSKLNYIEIKVASTDKFQNIDTKNIDVLIPSPMLLSYKICNAVLVSCNSITAITLFTTLLINNTTILSYIK